MDNKMKDVLEILFIAAIVCSCAFELYIEKKRFQECKKEGHSTVSCTFNMG
jgi:hypothetical protein